MGMVIMKVDSGKTGGMKMIYDKIENAPLYRGISPALDAALELIMRPGLDELPLGRQEATHGVYYTVMDCELKPFEIGRAHV